jgi:RHS repeat-associated protein
MNIDELARYAETENIDKPLTQLRSGTTTYYEADGLGSITSLTSGTGAIANTYTYDSFGKLTASTGSTTNRFQYTAREFDSESGLYYYRARYYDPTAGRFVTEDPMRFRAGVNFYTYVKNRATNLRDPFGLVCLASGGSPRPCSLSASFQIGGECNYFYYCSPTNWGVLGIPLDDFDNFIEVQCGTRVVLKKCLAPSQFYYYGSGKPGLSPIAPWQVEIRCGTIH